MTSSIPIPSYANVTQYDHIQATRPTDGAKLRAQRVVVDEHTAIRWTIVMVTKLEQYIVDELPMYEDAEWKVRKQYTTSELIDRAREVGFVDWQQSQVGESEGFAYVDSEYRKVRVGHYQLPDPTPYPTD